MNLAKECLERNVSRVPNRTALIDGLTGKIFTYRELNEKVNSMANALRALGIEKGDRVSIYLPNIPEFIIALFANSKIGAISVPFNIMFKKMEIDYILNNSEVKCVVGMAQEASENILPILDQLPSVENIIVVGDAQQIPKNDKVLKFDDLISQHKPEFQSIDLDEEEPVSLLYTSGTTGRPKGALATHSNWLSMTWLSAYQIVPMTDEDIVLIGFPFFHVALVIAVLPTLYVGGTVLALKRFFPQDALDLIGRYRVTHFMGTPTMWTYLIDEYLKSKENGYDVSSLWQGQSAGGPLPAELGKRIEETFGIVLVECYGATECSSTVTHSRFRHPSPGSPGWPTPGWEIKVTDNDGKEIPNGEIGELWCKGPGVIKEYWKDPEMTMSRIVDGWWRSGDLAYISKGGHTDGQLFIVDRKDDMVVCGGYNIYPTEVEGYLVQYPKVLQAIVIGVPDKVKGQIPKAYIILEPGESCTIEEIQEFSKKSMAAYKSPREFEFVKIEELPQTASGKILKRELRTREEKKRL